jgi:hypothetical protein
VDEKDTECEVRRDEHWDEDEDVGEHECECADVHGRVHEQWSGGSEFDRESNAYNVDPTLTRGKPNLASV